MPDVEKAEVEKVAPIKSLRWARDHAATVGEGDGPVSLRARLSALLRRLTNVSSGSRSDDVDQVEGSESSASVHQFASNVPPLPDGDWSVDAVVVENNQDAPAVALANGTTLRNGTTDTGTRSASDEHGSDGARSVNGSLRRADSRAGSHGSGWRVWHLVRDVAWPACRDFFEPRYEDVAVELDFQKVRAVLHDLADRQARYFHSKRPAAFFSLCLVLNYILYLSLNPAHSLFERMYVGRHAQVALIGSVFYGPFTLFTLPLPLMVAFDWPIRQRILFQTWLTVAVWYCGWVSLSSPAMSERAVRGRSNRGVPALPRGCGQRCALRGQGLSGADNVARRAATSSDTARYLTMLPALALFSLGSRSAHFVGSLIGGIFLIVFVALDSPKFARVIVCYALVHVFSLWLSYTHDMIERRVWTSTSPSERLR